MSMMKPLPRTAEVLLVDDDEVDAFLTQECLRNSNFPINLHHVANGQHCLNFLRKQDTYQTVPTPDLIILDMHMPVMNGVEVLTEIHSDTHLNNLPVVVMSHSCDEADISTMYQLGCKQYVMKSLDLCVLNRVIHQICEDLLQPEPCRFNQAEG